MNTIKSLLILIMVTFLLPLIAQEKLSGGNIEANQTIVIGDTPNIITGSMASGGSETYSYHWEKSKDGTLWNKIPGATQSTYQPSVISTKMMYRRIVNDNSFNAYSNIVTITVVDWKKVSIVRSENEVKGLIKITYKVIGKSSIPFGGKRKLYAKAEEMLKKEAALSGADVVYVYKDEFSNSPINNVYLEGTPYKK